jgi:hypothetical protein
MSNDVSEEHVTSTFRVEEQSKHETKMKQVARKAACYLLPDGIFTGFMVNQVVLGWGFSEYFDFLCQFPSQQLRYTHLSLSSRGYNRPNCNRGVK